MSALQENSTSTKRKYDNHGRSDQSQRRCKREHLSELNYVVKQLDNYTLYTPINRNAEKSWGDMMDEEDNAKENSMKKREYSKSRASLTVIRKSGDSGKENQGKFPNKPTVTANPPRPKEKDPKKLTNRQRQIDIGKNTEGYRHYIQDVARSDRTVDHPWTPDKATECSTRSWQGVMRIWRRKLHFWDPEHVIRERQETFFNISSSTIISDDEIGSQTVKRLNHSVDIDDDRSSCISSYSNSQASSNEFNDDFSSISESRETVNQENEFVLNINENDDDIYNFQMS